MVKGLYWLLDVAIRKPEVPDITSNVVSRCFGRTPNIAVTMTILSEKHTTSKAAVAEDPCRNENFPPWGNDGSNRVEDELDWRSSGLSQTILVYRWNLNNSATVDNLLVWFVTLRRSACTGEEKCFPGPTGCMCEHKLPQRHQVFIADATTPSPTNMSKNGEAIPTGTSSSRTYSISRIRKMIMRKIITCISPLRVNIRTLFTAGIVLGRYRCLERGCLTAFRWYNDALALARVANTALRWSWRSTEKKF